MDYFTKLLRQNAPPPTKAPYNHVEEFQQGWAIVYETLTHPDERQLSRGIKTTRVPESLQAMVEALRWESTLAEEGLTGACMEYLLKNDVLGTLVRLSEHDRPPGIQLEVLRTVQNMVVLLDEQFLVHSVVHRAVLRLLKTCVGDEIQEQLDGRNRVMGAAGNAVRTSPTEYEEDLVDLLCLLCSRIRTFRELLMIFFYDKHWYHAEPLTAVPEEDEEDDEEDEKPEEKEKETEQQVPATDASSGQRSSSPTPSQETITSAPVSSKSHKPEYEFLLLNYLLRFVHREGKIGEFARAGLLFLMDVAMSPGVPIHRLGDVSATPATSSAAATDPIADAALALAEYILDGDFCEVLGAGLVAVYSLLPTKLEIRAEYHGPSQQAMTIGSTGPLTDEEKEERESLRQQTRGIGMDYSDNPEFKARLDHFIKVIEFLQDVLRRNVSVNDDNGTLEPASFVGSAIVQSILTAVRSIFLENVLYPSILECSDTDGSSVAVMSYIEVMFRTLQDYQFAEMLIDFLVSEDDTYQEPRKRSQSMITLDKGPPAAPKEEIIRARKMKRRKSSAMILLEMEAPSARRESKYFSSMGRFNFKDLLLANMGSSSIASKAAALQLMQTLIVHHCHITVDRLFIYSYDPLGSSSPLEKALSDDDDVFTYPGAETDIPKVSLRIPETSYLMHEQELNLYLGLVARIDPAHGRGAFSTGYDNYLRDSLICVASHSCSSCEADLPPAGEDHPRRLLDVNDPVLSLILQSLRHFYFNSPEQNVALTGMLAAVASCPERSLKGWLLFGSDGTVPLKSAKKQENDLDLDDDRSVDFGANERLTRNELPMPIHGAGPLSQPVVLSIMQGLVVNLDRFRDLIPGFDTLLAERRQGLVFSENLTDALSLSFDMSTNTVTGVSEIQSSPRRSTTESTPPSKPRTTKRGWTSFLSPKKTKSISDPNFPPRTDSLEYAAKTKSIEASPFGSHYQKTRNITVEPLAAPVPTSGLWAPTEKRDFNLDEDEVFASGQWGENPRSDSDTASSFRRSLKEVGEETTSVTLSQLLDNVVILEESVKELSSIIHARRSLGIDALRYL